MDLITGLTGELDKVGLAAQHGIKMDRVVGT
jgi:hypothetical protein